MRKIAIVSQKGGVGKTTTVLNLGAALSKLGERVLMVDMDPQAHLTIYSGFELENLKFSLYDALIGKISIPRIIEGVSMRLSLVPSIPILSELEMKKLSGSEFLLKEAFKGFGAFYNYILLDTPPSIGVLTVNALCFAEEIFIVLQTEYLALKTLPLLLKSIDKVKMSFNPTIEITGVIACLYDQRRRIDRDVMEKFKDSVKYKYRMFRTAIRKNVALAESTQFGKDIFMYASSSYGAQDYLSLAIEVIKMKGGRKGGIQ